MARLPTLGSADGLSRMADFERWGEAAEGPLGLDPGAFRAAYAADREAASRVALEACPVVPALLALLRRWPRVEMTAKQLLE